MSYPYDKRYIEQIKEKPSECERIRTAYSVLMRYYIDTHDTDELSIPLSENFKILGEAFQYASDTLDGVTDEYHFMWDVLDELLTPKEEAK